MIHVSPHACERWIERVQPCTFDEARAAILSHERALEAAAKMACEVVKLGDGSRLILHGSRVVTCYGRGELPRQCRHTARLV